VAYREPWLRGPIPDVHYIAGALFNSFTHAREDLTRWTEGLTDAQVWEQRGDVAPVGFHIRHIGGSVDRLVTYALGGQLSVAQFSELGREKEPGETLAGLMAALDASFEKAEAAVRKIDPANFAQPVAIGRSRLMTTVGGLLIHIAEHTQRHVGAAIVTAKMLRRDANAP
jgi:hypothetical protein